MIREKLTGLNNKQKADIKSEDLCKLNYVGVFNYKDLKIEIISFEKIDGGVQARVKAWRGNKQLGFMDGSVEIETINIYNPPILVDDLNGDIIYDIVDIITGQATIRKLKEDPIRAIQEALYEAVRKIGKEDTQIQEGKIGTTTSVFYSGAGNGYSAQWEVADTWANVRSATSGNDAGVANPTFYMGITQQNASGYIIGRLFLPFDTSALPDGDTVSGATLSVYPEGTVYDQDNDGDDFIAIVGPTTQADPTTLVQADYDTCGAVDSPSEGATRLDLGSFNAGAVNDFVLNATGISWISKTGYTLIGAREGHDVVNSAIANAKVNGAIIYLSEQAGTTSDPTLTVTHAAPAGPANLKSYNTNLKANIKSINGNPIANVKSLNTNV